ncbi:MAG TPA: DUF2945 domain-containing protein [Rudaea sp.]
MTQRFKIGDHVTWNSEAGHVSGTIIKVHTADFDYKGYTHHATQDDPQYEIKSDKTDHAPAAKPMAAASPSPHKELSACLPLQNESCGPAGHCDARSNRHPIAVEFVVLVVAAQARAEIGEIMDELDCRDPFDHLEPQLILAAQP